MGDYCKGCAARPGEFTSGHRVGCRAEFKTVCGVKLPGDAGAICAVPASECDEHDVMRAMTSLWLACGFIHPSGNGDTLCAMADRARVRIEELVEIVNGQASERKARQAALEEQFKKHRVELAAGRDAWQKNYLEILTAIGVADDVARGRDPVEACKAVVELSNERCDHMLKAEADVRRLEVELTMLRGEHDEFHTRTATALDENAADLARVKRERDAYAEQRDGFRDLASAWANAASMNSPTPIASPEDLCERIRAMVGQRDATAAARDRALDMLGDKGDEIVSLRKLLEETENQRRDEVQAWQAAASADQLVDIPTPEALAVRLRDLVETRAQLQDKVGKIVEVMCKAGRGKMAVEDDVADLARQYTELVDEMVRGGDPSAVIESVAALQDEYNPTGSAASSRIETGEQAPAELRDAFLDAVAQETADRVFSWLVTGKLPGGPTP